MTKQVATLATFGGHALHSSEIGELLLVRRTRKVPRDVTRREQVRDAMKHYCNRVMLGFALITIVIGLMAVAVRF
jgi:hypothetical protein